MASNMGVKEKKTDYTMDEFMDTNDTRSIIKEKLRQNFDGKIARKDLTKHIKEGANVPVYVLEFLLGQYCSSDDEDIIEDGVKNVKRILADNFVRPDEAQKVLSVLRERGSYTVIDKITVHLNLKEDRYEAEFSNLVIKNIPIHPDYPSKYPNGDYTKEEIREILTISLELRRRVKEQLKKIGGMEFYDVNFSYIDKDTFEENYVSVPETGGGKLIPEGMGNPGNVYTVSHGKTGMVGVYRLETQMLPGNGKIERTGIGTNREAKEATNTALNFLKANGNSISGAISITTKDYIINYQDLNGLGISHN